MTVREMLTKWNVQVNHEGLDKFEGQLEAIKHRLDFLAAVEVAKGLYELVEKFSAMAEQLHLASESAGLTVEQMQKLSFAAGQAGVSSDNMQTSMFRLSRALYGARNGSEESLKAFSKLGISPDQIASFHTSEDAMMAIADRMKHIKDPVEKSALAMQLMGRGSRDMVGFLSQGSAAIRGQGKEAMELGAIMSGPQIEALVELEHTFQKFWALMKAIAGTIAAQVAPVFKYLVEDFIKFFQANREILQLNITNWLGEAAFGFGFLWEAVKFGIGLMIKLAETFHLEGHILDTMAAIGSVIGALFLIKGVVNGVISTVNLLKSAWTILTTAWEIGVAIMEAPLLPWIIGIGAVIIAVHDLWTLFKGGSLEDTWIGQAAMWISKMLDKIPLVGEAIKALMNPMAAGEKLVEGIGNFFSGGAGTAAAGAGSVPVGDIASSNIQGDQNMTVSNQIEINVPPGTHPADVGKHVQTGIKDHLDGLMRQTKRSLTPAVAH